MDANHALKETYFNKFGRDVKSVIFSGNLPLVEYVIEHYKDDVLKQHKNINLINCALVCNELPMIKLIHEKTGLKGNYLTLPYAVTDADLETVTYLHQRMELGFDKIDIGNAEQFKKHATADYIRNALGIKPEPEPEEDLVLKQNRAKLFPAHYWRSGSYVANKILMEQSGAVKPTSIIDDIKGGLAIGGMIAVFMTAYIARQP